ncbi:MAG TPA: hypothetical protein VK191_06910 [Symbiobacteriaceae bacterium]|nr:hypothetical protein [Symbiobacteriaceae bacterium]
MRRRGLYLLWLTVLMLGVLLGPGAVQAQGEAWTKVADGVRGVQPTDWQP